MVATSPPPINTATRRDVVNFITEYRLVRQPRLFSRFLTTLAASGRGTINEKSRRTARDVIFFLAECYFRSEEASITDVYLAAEVAKTTAIRCVDLLAKLGIVKRTQDGRDRRRASIVLAEPYCAILEHFVAEAFNDFKEVIETRAAVQLRLAKDALKESEERFRDFAEAGSDWLWETDAEARITWVSEGCRRLTGDPDDHLLGKTLEEIASGESSDTESFNSWLERVRRRLRFHDVAIVRNSAAGKRLRLRISGKPHFDADGRFLGYRGTTRNVTLQKESEDRVLDSEHRLMQAINAVSDSVALFDADDRLVICNRQYHCDHPVIKRIAQRGITFGALFAAKVRTGLILDAIGREEAFIAERMEYHRNPVGARSHRLAGGQIMTYREQKLPDGSSLIVGLNITGIEAAEARAEADRKRLIDAIEAISDGMALYDANDRLVLFNEAFRNHLSPVIKRLKPGLRFSDILVALVDSGFYSDFGEREAYLTQRMEKHYRAESVIVHEARGDRWIAVSEYRTSDGGTLVIRHDMTDRRRAEMALEHMASAIDALYEYFLVYDAQERLIIANTHARDLNAPCPGALEIGATFEERQRRLIACGMLPDAIGNEEAFIAERLRRFRAPGEPFILRWHGGKTFSVREHRLPDGGTVIIATRADPHGAPRPAAEPSESKIAFGPVRARGPSRSARRTAATPEDGDRRDSKGPKPKS